MTAATDKAAVAAAPDGAWIRVMPAVFVLIWSTGFVVAKFGLPFSSPLWFLNLRFCGVVLVLLIAMPFVKVPWPPRRAVKHIAVAGLLLQAGYLGGVWVAISEGMPAGLAALIVGLQPVLTAFIAPAIGERVSGRQWAGFALGFFGVVMVVLDKIALIALPFSSIALAVMALFSITIGTLYQKRKCPSFDLRAGTLIQFCASLLVTVPLALLFEVWNVRFTQEFIGALVWSILVLSIGGMALLFPLLRRGEATRVTSLFYLVPPVTALMAWAVFGERFSQRAMIGMACAVVGVALVVVRRR
ncbi:MAG: DMT family transporter [Burkholderiaceae bacterium]